MKIFFKKLFVTFVITLSILPSAASASWWDDWITKPAAQLYKKTAVWAKKHPTAAKVAAVSAGVTTVSLLAYAGYRWYSQPAQPQNALKTNDIDSTAAAIKQEILIALSNNESQATAINPKDNPFNNTKKTNAVHPHIFNLFNETSDAFITAWNTWVDDKNNYPNTLQENYFTYNSCIALRFLGTHYLPHFAQNRDLIYPLQLNNISCSERNFIVTVSNFEKAVFAFKKLCQEVLHNNLNDCAQIEVHDQNKTITIHCSEKVATAINDFATKNNWTCTTKNLISNNKHNENDESDTKQQVNDQQDVRFNQPARILQRQEIPSSAETKTIIDDNVRAMVDEANKNLEQEQTITKNNQSAAASQNPPQQDSTPLFVITNKNDDSTQTFKSYIPQELKNDSTLNAFISASLGNTKTIGTIKVEPRWITSQEEAKIAAILYIIDQFSPYNNDYIRTINNPQDKSLSGIIINDNKKHADHADYQITFKNTSKLVQTLYNLLTKYGASISNFEIKFKQRMLQIRCAPQQASTIEKELKISFTKKQPKQASPTFSYQNALPCYQDTIEAHFNKNSSIYQAYDKQYACNVLTAPQLVLKGQNIFYRLSTGKATAENFKQQVEQRYKKNPSKPLWKIYLDEICIPLCWAAYYQDLAIGTTESGFTEGTFTLIDKTGEITAILYEYLNIVKQAGYDIGSCKNLKGSNPLAYYRKSTHPGKEQFGIDIVDENQKAILILPQEKCHLLIGLTQCPDGTKRILFKPENHGIYNPQDLVLHGWEAIVAQARKNGWIRNLLQLTLDDSDDNRKERVPEKISNLMETFLQNANVKKYMPKKIQQIIADASKKDIALTLALLKSEIEDTKNTDYTHVLNSTITQIMRILPQAPQKLGNEVLITHEDMMVFGYQGMLALEKNELTTSYKKIVESWIKLRKSIFIDRKNKLQEASDTTQQAALSFASTFETTVQQIPSLFNGHEVLGRYLKKCIDIITERKDSDEFKIILLEDDLFDQQQQKFYTYKDTCKLIIQNYVTTCCSLLHETSSSTKYQFTQEEQDAIGEQSTPLLLDHFRAYLPAYAYNNLVIQAKTFYKKLKSISHDTRKQIIATITKNYNECKEKLLTANNKYNYYSGHGQLQSEQAYMLKQIKKINTFSQQALNNCPNNNALAAQFAILQKSFNNHLLFAKTLSEYKRLAKKTRQNIILAMENLQSNAMGLSNSFVVLNKQ